MGWRHFMIALINSSRKNNRAGLRGTLSQALPPLQVAWPLVFGRVSADRKAATGLLSLVFPRTQNVMKLRRCRGR